MPNELPLPPDMQHLIEKRNGEERRGSSSEPDAADGHKTANVPADDEPAAGDSSMGDVERRKTIRRCED